MPTIAKCANCKQFNQETYNAGDPVCARCKKAMDKGLSQLPDRPSTAGKKNDDGNGNGSGSESGKED